MEHALIIESDYLVSQVIENHLRDLGLDTFDFAMDEAEAVAAATARCPDLITADVLLVGGCGISAVQSICAKQPIPVVYITVTPWVVRERCSDAVVLQKPFGILELKAGIEQARRAA